MTGTPCQSATLDRIVALWAAKIAALFATIVEAVLTILHELSVYCREVPLRQRAAFLPSATSAFSILAPKRSLEFERAVMKDIELSVSAWVREAWGQPRRRDWCLRGHEKPETKDIERVLKGVFERILKG